MNGYTSIAVNGEKVGIKFGLPAIRQFVDKLQAGGPGKFISDGSYNELGIAHIIYAGYCCNCDIKDEPALIKFESFYSLVESSINDEAKLQEIKEIVKCFEDSQYVKQVVDNMNGADGAKKKQKSRGSGMK